MGNRIEVFNYTNRLVIGVKRYEEESELEPFLSATSTNKKKLSKEWAMSGSSQIQLNVKLRSGR